MNIQLIGGMMMKGFLNLILKSCFLIVFVAIQNLFVLGQTNTIYGNGAGANNTTGINNSFFGNAAGMNNGGGFNNAYFGDLAGAGASGSQNSFFGQSAGSQNRPGSYNTLIGNNTQILTPNITVSTAIGAYAAVSTSNSLVLGSINGVNGAQWNTNVGIGTTAPQQTLHVNGNNEILSTGSGAGFKFRNRNSTSLNDDWVWYSDSNVARLWRAGQGDVMRIQQNGILTINGWGSGGIEHLCRNGNWEISFCSSSIRYKSNVNSFTSGLDLIRQLRPVSFNWTQNDLYDFGLVAEEVAAVEPLLATYNEKGEVEGVKYDRVGVVLVNAVNEQQTQIELQQKQIREQAEIITRQQTELEGLKKLVCLQNPAAELCQ